MKTNIYLQRFREKVKENSLKQSKQREDIIKIFIKQEHHIDAETLYAEIKKTHPQIGYTTVYRTLKLLCDLNMAISHSFNKNMAFFEPIFDSDTHHDHLICTNCGKIEEFQNEEIEVLQKEIAKKHNFKIINHVLNIYGICKECEGKLNDK
jgi:Fur family ferric uptake transcriptional regulator